MAEEAVLTFEEFTELVNEYQASIRVFVRMLGVEADFVDDIAQETFLTAYKRKEQFQKETNFGKWIRTIARNIIANERRKEARRSRIMFDNLARETELSYTDSKDEPDIKEIITALKECLNNLPERQYTIIQYRYYHDKKSTELSKRFNLSSSSIRKALMKIRAALQECIEAETGEVHI